MFCAKCGFKDEQNGLFCTNCGNKFSTQPPTVPIGQPAGNPPVPNGNPIGPNGNPIGPNGNPTIPNGNPFPNNPPRKSNGGIIAIVAACAFLLMVLIGVIVFILINSGSSSTPTTPTTPSSAGGTTQPVQTPKEPSAVNNINSSTISNIVSDSYTDYGIYVYDVESGDEFSYNGNQVFLSSALSQIVILDTLSQVTKDNNIDVDTEKYKFTFNELGKRAPESPMQDGEYLPLRNYIEAVAMYGDNNKSNHIVDYIGDLCNVPSGFTIINQTLSKQGHRYTEINRKTVRFSKDIDTSVSPNQTTAAEIGRMYHHLIYESSFGDDTYMKNIFKSINDKGEAIGIKKYVPTYYDVYNVNAFTNQNTNNVAIVTDGNKEYIIVVLSQTEDSHSGQDAIKSRDAVLDEVMDSLVNTLF